MPNRAVPRPHAAPTVPCEEYGQELASDSAELRLELTDDDEPIIYCAERWEREFGVDP